MGLPLKNWVIPLKNMGLPLKNWVIPLKNMGLPLKNWVIPLKNVGLPLTNFVKIKASPPKNSIFFTLPLKKSSIFITYPWRIPWFLNRRGADIKYNSPVVLLGVRAWADPRFVSFSGLNFLNFRRASLSISQEKKIELPSDRDIDIATDLRMSNR